MKTSIVRSTLVAILMLGLTIPSIASASFFNWGCRYQGTWFGVMAEDNPALAGWMVTAEGRSYWHGTNNLEWTNYIFDPRLPMPDPMDPDSFVFAFETAVNATTMRGNWMRTGYNTFVYTTTGFGIDANRMPVYVAKMSGTITLSDDCSSDVITATMEVFPVDENGVIPNPFIPSMGIQVDIPDVYAHRVFVDLP